MFMIGAAPVSAQTDVFGVIGIGVFLAVLFAIAIALHVVTAPQSDDATPSTSRKRLGSAL